jgi:hypothetical protein
MTFRNHWPMTLLLVAVAALGIRTAWTLTRLTTGWPAQLNQWSLVAVSLVGLEKPKLGDQSPESQATFWLNTDSDHALAGRAPGR